MRTRHRCAERLSETERTCGGQVRNHRVFIFRSHRDRRVGHRPADCGELHVIKAVVELYFVLVCRWFNYTYISLLIQVINLFLTVGFVGLFDCFISHTVDLMPLTLLVQICFDKIIMMIIK